MKKDKSETINIPKRDYKMFPGGKRAAQKFNNELNTAHSGDDKDVKMLRELAMRLKIVFPENEEDLKWFEEGTKGEETNYLFEWVAHKLELGQLHHNKEIK